ncbi:MAG: CBS domain-containing protein [Microscillaceae bacterium]|nr:CBS domain-containing protein [Microscillaceae bacterium]
MQNTDSIVHYMTKKPITFRPEQSIYEVIEVLLRKKISGAPILNDKEELVGIISEKDCLRVLVDSAYHNLPAGKVQDYMSHTVTTMRDDKSIVEVASAFLKTNFKRFPVVDKEGKLVGQISRSDVLRAVKDMRKTTWQEVLVRAANDHTVIKENFKDVNKVKN